MFPIQGFSGRYIAQLPQIAPAMSHATCTRTFDPSFALDGPVMNTESLAYSRPEVWLPSDLAMSCGIRHESGSPTSFLTPGPIDSWDSGHAAEQVDTLVREPQTQLESLHEPPLPSASPISFPTLHVDPSQGWSKAMEERPACMSNPENDRRSPSVSSTQNNALTPSEPSSVGRDANSETASVASTASGNVLLIERLDGNVTEGDVEQHFSHPPEWPASHPMRRAYAQVSQKMRATLPVSPEPFGVQSVRIIRQGSVSQAEVRFTSPQDGERALVEMQHTMLIPKQTPWNPVRVLLSTAAATPPPPERRSRPRVQRTTTSQSEPASRRSGPRRRTSDPNRSASVPDSLATAPRVPTTLTFVQSEDGETKSGAPMLASALAVAHTSSALDPNNTTVFVGSLFTMASEATLYSLFSPYGPILSVNIPRGQDCGFVQFARKEDAARAIAEMQNCPMAGGTLRLSWGRSIGEKAAARAATRAGLRWVEDVA